jgi:cysteine desulfurase
LPNNLNISFPGIESDALVAALDARGIAASSGSACSNSTWEPSHVLMAMGVPIRRAVASVRFSLGESTTEAQVLETARAVAEELAGLQRRAAIPRGAH